MQDSNSENSPSPNLVDSDNVCSTSSSDHNEENKEDKSKNLLKDLQQVAADLEKNLNKKEKHKEHNEDNHKNDHKSHDLSSGSQNEHIISTLSDVKADMTKILRIIHGLDQKTNQTKCKTDYLKHEVDQLREVLNKSNYDTKSNIDSSKLCDNISICDTQSNDSSCSTQTGHSADSNNSNDSVSLISKDDNNSKDSKDSNCSSQTTCSYDEFHKFKSEVLLLLKDLADQINRQMGMLAGIMSTSSIRGKNNLNRYDY